MSSTPKGRAPSPSKIATPLISGSSSPTINAGSMISVSEPSEGLSQGSIAMSLLEARIEQARARQRKIAFTCAMANCLCGGSILLYCLYAPYFQKVLGYNQMQVNAVAIAGELGMYLPVPIFGFLSDRSGPQTLSILSAALFGPGYLLASFAIAKNLPFWVMIVAWTLVGAGTSSMYFAAVTTCAKNFTGNNRGIALALPIAAFGLSSLWESQVVSRVFVGENGELRIVDAFMFFAVLLVSVGLLGGVGLVVVTTEEERKEKDVETFGGERSPLLGSNEDTRARYGGTLTGIHADDLSMVESTIKKESWMNHATLAFLRDRTMWLFAGGVFLVTGSGEAFINNMGTIIQTLYTPDTSSTSQTLIIFRTPKNHISAAAHVSIVALTSTAARLCAGSLSDYLAPAAVVEAAVSEPAEVERPSISENPPKRFILSRMYLLLFFAILMLFGQLFLASGIVDNDGKLFWIVSSSIGAGYGAVFTLAPTIVSVVWGVENFGTNWGIVTITPAIGATIYGLIFAKGYDEAAGKQNFKNSPGSVGGKLFSEALGGLNWAEEFAETGLAGAGSAGAKMCYGKECYDKAFYVMGASVAFACLLWVFAWRSPGGWAKRGVVV